jgi:hypothetical protein
MEHQDQTHQKICIIGYGSIGKLATYLFRDHAEVLVINMDAQDNNPWHYDNYKYNDNVQIIAISSINGPINYQNYDHVIITTNNPLTIMSIQNYLLSSYYQGKIYTIDVLDEELLNTPVDHMFPIKIQLTTVELKYSNVRTISTPFNPVVELYDRIINP